jgi:hypothetical protein
LLRGIGGIDMIGELWPIVTFILVITAVAVWAYRETLD